MLSNLELLHKLKLVYDPKTAFGNPALLKIMNSFRSPNKEGLFESEASAESFTINRVDWKCVDCGASNREEDFLHEFREGEKISRKCRVCNKEHVLEIIF
ncbi:MAG: hypothetical protein NTZ97_01175 [Candidatus Moranbacteria bacterium]|nr:hypothetical protein [Candidatus Moranbacteria bacterium]